MSFNEHYVRCGWCGASICTIDNLIEAAAIFVYTKPSELEVLEMKKVVAEEFHLILDKEGCLSAPRLLHHDLDSDPTEPETLPTIKKSPCTLPER